MQTVEFYSSQIIKKTMDFLGNKVKLNKTDECRKLAERCSELSKDKMLEDETNRMTQSRYDYLKSYLKQDVLMDVIHLAVAQHIYPEFYHMLKNINGQGTTFYLALRMNGLIDSWRNPQLKGGYDLLCRFLSVEKRTENFLYSELFADERFVLYLTGDDYLSDAISDFTNLFFPWECTEQYYGVDQYTERIQKIFDRMKNMRGYVFQMSGKEGRGKRSVLKSLAMKEDTGWVFVDTAKLLEQKRDLLKQNIWCIHREAILYDIGICFYHYEPEKAEKNVEYFVEQIRGDCENLIYPITICTEEKAEIIPVVSFPVYRMGLKDCSRSERIELWKGFAEEYKISMDSRKYGIQYCLNPGDIRKIFRNLQIEYEEDWKDENFDNHIADFCMETRKTPGKGSIHRAASEYVMDDLQLEASQKMILKYLCAYIKKSYLVYDEWKMESKFAYGKGVTSLFYGPPGTGKTMAAYVLSNELKIPLYRVDLSQIVDKYIGETEKRLDEVFEYAQKSNVILFFDEADSIFGKRTDVKDSKDKYANTEVSFILQRIEEYDGIIILATNYRNNIDDAFMRRMKYVVEFKMPDRQTRMKIWKNSFSEEIPMQDIDFEYLAEKVQLSGGYIKNIIINAVFQAAYEESCVTMKHMINGIRNEYIKLGKVLTPQDLEKYAYYF